MPSGIVAATEFIIRVPAPFFDDIGAAEEEDAAAGDVLDPLAALNTPPCTLLGVPLLPVLLAAFW